MYAQSITTDSICVIELTAHLTVITNWNQKFGRALEEAHSPPRSYPHGTTARIGAISNGMKRRRHHIEYLRYSGKGGFRSNPHLLGPRPGTRRNSRATR